MKKVMKAKLVWNGNDFGFPGSENLIIDLLSNAQRYIRAITTFVDLRKIPEKEQVERYFSDVVEQFIEYMRCNENKVVDRREVSGIKIKINGIKGLPKFSLKYRPSEDVLIIYKFKIANRYGLPLNKVIEMFNGPCTITAETKSKKKQADKICSTVVPSDLHAEQTSKAPNTENSIVQLLGPVTTSSVIQKGAIFIGLAADVSIDAAEALLAHHENDAIVSFGDIAFNSLYLFSAKTKKLTEVKNNYANTAVTLPEKEVASNPPAVFAWLGLHPSHL